MKIKPLQLRVNGQIRLSKVRVIDDNNEQVGVIFTRDALEMAKTAGLDLVEIAPHSRPPVCKILDYGKYKYDLSKKNNKSRHNRLKEIRMSSRIEQHDIDFRTKNARKFLSKGDKVQIEMMFKGRDNAHKEIGLKTVNRIVETLLDVAKIDKPGKMHGNKYLVTLSPK